MSKIKRFMIVVFFVFSLSLAFCYFFGGFNTVSQENGKGEKVIFTFLTIPGLVSVSLPADSVDLSEMVKNSGLDQVYPAVPMEKLEWMLGVCLKKEGSYPGHELRNSEGHWILKAPPRTIRFFGPKWGMKIPFPLKVLRDEKPDRSRKLVT